MSNICIGGPKPQNPNAMCAQTKAQTIAWTLRNYKAAHINLPLSAQTKRRCLNYGRACAFRNRDRPWNQVQDQLAAQCRLGRFLRPTRQHLLWCFAQKSPI